MNKLRYKIFISILILIAGLVGFAPSARAAVPVWIVGFDANTDFEKSLETFLINLMAQVSARQETFQESYDLAKIMKAREDVNKLIFEAFSELRSEPLLIEFQQINQACGITSGAPLPTNKPGFTSGEFPEGKCLFYTQVQEYLRSRGLEIVSQPFNPSGLSGPAVDKSAVLGAIERGDDPLCLYGVRTNDGQCITIKLEGRIITNPDDFLFEEPVQKARDFLYCYFGPWRHFPWGETQKKSDLMRDNMKNYFLLTVARKLKFTQTAPPPEWYTEARCQIILASMECPLAAQPQSALASTSIPKDTSAFPVVNRDIACVSRNLVNSPTLTRPLEFIQWSQKDIHKLVTREENSVGATLQKIQITLQDIISQYQQERQAEYIAGQGIRPEKYLIGWRAYTKDEYKQLEDKWAKGGTYEGNGVIQPTGDWFYFDTGNIISPAVILLDKLQAATQAEFNLAQDAFQAPKSPDNSGDAIGLVSGSGKCPAEQAPKTVNNVQYVCQEFTNAGTPPQYFHYWITTPQDTGSSDQYSGLYVPTDKGNLPLAGRALSAPWEDPNVQLPQEYITGQAPKSKDELPSLSGNYFNQWYKDILQLHDWHFSAIVQQWFNKPEKSFFTPDRQYTPPSPQNSSGNP